ncbi:hydrogenobyrinic acid a,c-diamide synthase (glutamine-hydrolysing) /cobyrinate a,c-diamide synthase [Geothermobacter ehrlichii]|uniref:Cobyrinate a,c-diamide synthase n=1 Tax=Geothermobacter ehrlichii TaxID=213224 RepID=A0A5D3WJI5_9BACT|nr:cobyrinate a,c-diamide synthase [Geothermobacter ehrlichii]TYO98457.1 hydrogenobyrinic acid a,c-diamide synthase (glutamine-hydrolysing) /cobyrinate a,c-diamide synthase [Geothermobacter ehrlichii]
MFSPLIIAAPSSGSGKTTVTLGLLAALKKRGVTVAPFKVGPDYIDPGHHAAACGRVSRNLDGWMCGEAAVRESFARGCAGAGLAVVEGVMGLFDGAAGDTDAGSTAEIARWLDGRILLLVDARSQARSAAALVKGFVDFDPRLRFAGVVFNRVGSSRHRQLLEQALASTPGLPPLLGCLPRHEEIRLPERHLGLVIAGETGHDYAPLAELVEKHLDLDRLLAGLSGKAAPYFRPLSSERGDEKKRARIAVAKDAAFCFCYPENLELLQAAGAELVFFSPLAEALPDGIDGLYLPGGYPELHAERLAGNRSLLAALRQRVEAGLPVYAECGGLMLLASAIDGRPMAGVLPGVVRMLPKRRALGYRQVRFVADTPLGPAGTLARGHEFHYSELELSAPVERAYHLGRQNGEPLGAEGFRVHNVLASYVHLHFAGNPALAENFVRFCEERKASGRQDAKDTKKIF